MYILEAEIDAPTQRGGQKRGSGAGRSLSLSEGGGQNGFHQII